MLAGRSKVRAERHAPNASKACQSLLGKKGNFCIKV